MAISKDIQHTMLQNSFEALKSNFVENHESIQTSIVKMAAIDIEEAISMWEYVLVNNHKSLISGNQYEGGFAIASGVSFELSFDINGTIELDKIADAIKTRYIVKEAVYKISGNLHIGQAIILANYISRKEFDVASELITFVFENKNMYAYENGFTLGEFLAEVIDQFKYTYKSDEEIISFFQYWIEQMSNQKEKGIASIKFVEIFA